MLIRKSKTKRGLQETAYRIVHRYLNCFCWQTATELRASIEHEFDHINHGSVATALSKLLDDGIVMRRPVKTVWLTRSIRSGIIGEYLRIEQ